MTEVRVYLDLFFRKDSARFLSKYPLCVTYTDRGFDTRVHELTSPMVLLQTITSVDMGLALSDALLVNFDEEIEEPHIISNGLVDEVEQGQIYVNKRTLVEVIQRYALLRQFRFKVVRLCTASFTLKCQTIIVVGSLSRHCWGSRVYSS